MKPFLLFTGSLVFSGLLLAAQAPTATPTVPSPLKTTTKTTNRRAAAYQGPKVVADTKALDTKMLRESKPTLKPVPVPPVKR